MEDRTPRNGETCVTSQEDYWKRDALLFDRIYVPSPESKDIPVELTFGVYKVDCLIYDEKMTTANATAGFSAMGYDFENKECHDSAMYANDEMHRLQIVKQYGQMGVVVIPSYESRTAYIADFPAGTAVAYEAALNNLPIVAHDSGFVGADSGVSERRRSDG